MLIIMKLFDFCYYYGYTNNLTPQLRNIVGCL